MRPAAHLHDIGVSHDDADLVEADAQPFGGDLGEAGLVALAARLGADHDIDTLLGTEHADPGLLDRRADGGLDVMRDTAPQQPAARFGLLLPCRESARVREAERHVEALLVLAAVVCHADRVAVGHLVRRDEVPAPQLESVDPELFGGDLDQPFYREDAFRPARAAIGVGRRGVGEGRARAQPRDRHAIRAGDDARAFRQRRERDAARADIAQILRPQTEDCTVPVEGERHLRHEVAALVIADQRLAPLDGALDGPPDFSRRPGGQGNST